MTETKKKEAADYSESAVSLTNPPEVRGALDYVLRCRAGLNRVEDEIAALVPDDLANKEIDWRHELSAAEAALKVEVETHGGYQDRGSQTYALMQKKRTPIYNVGPFKALAQYAKFVPLVVKEAIDPDALKGQIKGKLLTKEELEKDEVITYRTTEAFILILPEVKVE